VAALVRAYVDDNQPIPVLAVQFGVAPQTGHTGGDKPVVHRRPSAVATRGDVDDN
jgi:hypothetical protein